VSVTAVRETAAPADLTSLPPRFTFKTDWGAANKKAGQPIQKNSVEKNLQILFGCEKFQTVSLSSLGTSWCPVCLTSANFEFYSILNTHRECAGEKKK
jgi:hypothetical protein